MRKLVNLAILAVALGVVACSSADRAPLSETRKQVAAPPAAVRNEAAAPPAAPANAAPATGAIRLTLRNTQIEFVGSSERTSQAGSFQQFIGTLNVPGDDLSAARLAIEIDMESTTSGIFLLTRHLKSSDFFDVKQYPKSWFVSTSIQPSTTPGATHVITGDLTLHGMTRTITAPANITLANGVLTLSSRFVIHQSEFGMVEAVKKTKDEVPVTVRINATRS